MLYNYFHTLHDRGSNFWDISFNVSNSIVERIFFSWRFLPNISTELSSDLNIIIVILQKYTFITWLLQWCILVHFEARLFAPWENNHAHPKFWFFGLSKADITVGNWFERSACAALGCRQKWRCPLFQVFYFSSYYLSNTNNKFHGKEYFFEKY